MTDPEKQGRNTYRRQARTTYRRPDFNQTAHISGVDERVEGYVGDSSGYPRTSRDPRTTQSSGFGIYRHMKPGRFR
jgi:hypothetical protein